MIKLIRDKKTGDYHTQDNRYQIEKGAIGWNVYEYDTVLKYHRYIFSCDTLKEIKESL